MPDQRQSPPTRIVVATIVLATVGLASLAGVLYAGLFMSGFSSGHGARPEEIADLASLLPNLLFMPAVSWASLVAAVLLHRGHRFGRPLAMVIATLLLVAAPLNLIVSRPWPENFGIVTWYAMLLPEIDPHVAVFHLLVGSFLLWALVTRPAAAPPAVPVANGFVATDAIRTRPRAVSVLATVLALFGIDSLIPILVRLAWLPLPGEVGMNNMGLRSSVLLAIGSIGASALLLRGALALHRGERLALALTFPSALIGGSWVALWAAAVISAVSTDVVDPLFSIPVLAIVAIACFGLVPIAALVTPLVRRRWFEPSVQVPAVQPTPRRRPGRVSAAWLGATMVAAVVAFVGLDMTVRAREAAEASEARLHAPEVPYGFLFDGAEYYRKASAHIPLVDLTEIDGVEELEPTAGPWRAFTLTGYPSTTILAAAPDSLVDPAATTRLVALYVHGEGRDIPSALCPRVELALPIDGGPCAIPNRLVYDDRWYTIAESLLVPVDRLTPTGVTARFDREPAAGFPTLVHEIDRVDPSVAVTIRTDAGGLVYLALSLADKGDLPADLCPFKKPDADIPVCP